MVAVQQPDQKAARRAILPGRSAFWLTLPLLGPCYTVPILLWRAILARVHTRAWRLFLLLPGAYALASGALAALAAALLGRSAHLAAVLQAVSPWHSVAKDLYTMVLLMAVGPPGGVVGSLGLTWLYLAVAFTLLLSPLYAWLLVRQGGAKTTEPAQGACP